jgi:hypothetical protein
MAVLRFAQAGILANSKRNSFLGGFVPRVSVAGYFAGGMEAGNPSATVDKFAFPSDTRTTLAGALSGGITTDATGMANSGVAGYVGTNPAVSPGANKFFFPSDTRVNIVAYFPNSAGSMANSGVAGYVFGDSGPTAIVRKVAFSNDVMANLATGLSTVASKPTGFANIATAGYRAGGNQSGSGNPTAVVDKFAFPSDTRTILATGLSAAKFGAGAMENFNVAGYVAGGNFETSQSATVEKFAFPSDTRTSLGTGLSVNRPSAFGNSNVDVAGYVTGGNTASIDKFAFPSDTRTTLAVGLSAVRNGPSGFSNQGAF